RRVHTEIDAATLERAEQPVERPRYAVYEGVKTFGKVYDSHCDPAASAARNLSPLTDSEQESLSLFFPSRRILPDHAVECGVTPLAATPRVDPHRREEEHAQRHRPPPGRREQPLGRRPEVEHRAQPH